MRPIPVEEMAYGTALGSRFKNERQLQYRAGSLVVIPVGACDPVFGADVLVVVNLVVGIRAAARSSGYVVVIAVGKAGDLRFRKEGLILRGDRTECRTGDHVER